MSDREVFRTVPIVLYIPVGPALGDTTDEHAHGIAAFKKARIIASTVNDGRPSQGAQTDARRCPSSP